MKKIIFGIFAHPDDEAFGPAGTLLKLKGEGYDIHLILLTDGDAGVNIDHVPDLATTRLAEWHQAAQLLGASSAHALHYPDGGLADTSFEEIRIKVANIVSNVQKSYTEPTEVSYMTFEPNGLTGHRDHIVASQLTTHIAKQGDTQAVWYYCLDSSQAPLADTAYYEPRAREEGYITDRIDVSDFLNSIDNLIDTHHSQRLDGAKRKALSAERLSIECFHVVR